MAQVDNRFDDVDFSALILGFSSAALSYMGFADGESSHPLSKNLELAAQNIEIINILEQKTRGNLTDEEQRLIKSVLTDLRLKYIDAKKS